MRRGNGVARHAACPSALATRTRAGSRHFAGRRSSAASSSASLAGSSSSSAGSTRTSAPASSPSSPSSVDVHAAWTGPRRPSTTISRMPDETIASIAASVVSVGASSSRVSASIRATSSATLPFPMTTARSCERSKSRCWKSGWPLYQATSSVAAHEPGRSSPGMPSRRSVCEPDCVDHGVVERRELVVRDVTADLDVSEEAEARPRGDLLERARHGLELRMIGRDTEPDEPPRCRQPLDHVDLDAADPRSRAGRLPRRTRQARSRRRDTEIAPSAASCYDRPCEAAT